MVLAPTVSTVTPDLAKALLTIPRLNLVSSLLVVTKAVKPEIITLSTPSIPVKAARALSAAPQPPPLKDTLYPLVAAAAAASLATACPAKATGVIAPKAHNMPNVIFAFIAPNFSANPRVCKRDFLGGQKSASEEVNPARR